MQQNVQGGAKKMVINQYPWSPPPPPPHTHTHKQTMYCRIANPANLDVERPLTITVYLGNQVQTVGTIRIKEPLNLLVILIPVFAGVIVLSAAIFIVVVAVFCRKTRQKDQRYDQLILELERLESSVARECKLGEATRRIPPPTHTQFTHIHNSHTQLTQLTHTPPLTSS